MKKKSSIIKLSIIGVALILGILLAFVSINGIKSYQSFLKGITIGKDFDRGLYAVYKVNTSDNENVEDLVNIEDNLNSAAQLLQKYFTTEGYVESSVRVEGYRIRAEVLNYNYAESILQNFGSPIKFTASLSTLDNPIVFTQNNVTYAEYVGYDSSTSKFIVQLKLDKDGKANLKSNQNSVSSLSISVLDSDGNADTSVTYSISYSSGAALVSGFTSPENAMKFASQIMSGSLNIPLELVDSVGDMDPLLGDNALMLFTIATFALVLVSCCWFAIKYKLLSLGAIVSNLFFAIFYMFLLSVFPFGLIQLSLATFTAIITSQLLITIFHNLVLSRLSKEYANGKSIKASLHASYKKNNGLILDISILSLVASLLMFILGTGFVKSFGLSLLIGSVVACFMALLTTKGIIKYMLNINSENQKIYALERGKGFENLGADDTDASILEAEAQVVEVVNDNTFDVNFDKALAQEVEEGGDN